MEPADLTEALWEPYQAARQGWDHPLVEAALRGEYDEQADPNELEEVFDQPLITARLNVLERKGNHEAFLNLASAAQHHDHYAAMLAKLDRIAEAVEYARVHLKSPGEVLTVVTALWEQGAQEEAFGLAEHGLTLKEANLYFGEPSRKLALANWLRDQAESLGQRKRALKAALVAVQQSPDLPSYLKAQELAGAEWPKRREALLKQLRRPAQLSRAGHVEIFLHEGLIDDAIAEVERGHDYRLIARVAQTKAAIEERPDWVIKACRSEAEKIMDEGHSDYCWLEMARAAYPPERLAEWRAYLDDQIERHKRKYKLRPMLTALRDASSR